MNRKYVCITGGSGFLGGHIKKMIGYANDYGVYSPPHGECELMRLSDVMNYLDAHKPDVVVHAAADVGGIGYNSVHGADPIYKNLQMGMNVIEACRRLQIGRLIMIGSVCAYPSPLPNIPAFERNLWDGYPEPSNGPYGVAKRTLIEMGMQYQKSYGMSIFNLILANLYGPGDTFDLNRCHVVPALVRKFVDAVETEQFTVGCWGDGSPTRDLLYVVDAAHAVLKAIRSPTCSSESINIATGQEFSIRCVAELCARLAGFTGRIIWDINKLNGQPRRAFDIMRALNRLDWCPTTDLQAGVDATVKDYRLRRHEFNSDQPATEPASQDAAR